MPLYVVRGFKALHGLVELLQVHVAQPFVVPNLPVVRADGVLRLVVDVDRSAVSPEEVERSTDLLQVGDVVRVQRGRGLEQRE